MTTITCISDTHGRHRELALRRGDILLVAGDFSSWGKTSEVADFDKWLGTLPFKHKIVVAGNHDRTAWFYGKETQKLITNAIYLQDSIIEVEGMSIFGYPWTPKFYDWYFMAPRHEMGEKVDRIIKCDILVSHGPPFGKLDYSAHKKENVGCEYLRNKVKEIKPKLHVFGHIHGSYGAAQDEDTIYANVSICDERYMAKHKPQTFIFENGKIS